MTEPTVEERIRAKAHELWEGEGRPEGQQERHWQLASQMIEDADGTEHDLDEGSIWRPEADGLNPIQGSGDASESRVNPLPSEKRPLD